MTGQEKNLEDFLLERATRYGFLSFGLFSFAVVITQENIYSQIAFGILGLAAVGLSFTKIPKRLVSYAAHKRGRGYISTFSVLLPLMLVVATAIAIAFPLMITMRGFKAPADILVALAIEIIIVFINLIILISNVMALSRR